MDNPYGDSSSYNPSQFGADEPQLNGLKITSLKPN